MENMAHQMKNSLAALQIRLDLAQCKASGSGGACFLLELPILDGKRPYESVREIVRKL